MISKMQRTRVLSAAAGAVLLWGLAAPGWAKLPPPSEEAKAKAAENAARAAWSGKVGNYKLCKSMDSVAARYFQEVRAGGKSVKPAVATPACVDPGPFVYQP